MPERSEIVSAARGYIGLPWVHMSHEPERGLDCVGLIWAVGCATGCIPEGAEKPSYGRIPDGKLLRDSVLQWCNPYWERDNKSQIAPLAKALPGDLALIAWRKVPLHVAWVSEFQGRTTLIHSYAEVGKVVEHGINHHWSNRVVGLYTFKGLI